MILPRTTLLAAVVVAAALGTSQTAKADGFYGTADIAISGIDGYSRIDESYIPGSAVRARIGVGVRVSRWALEAWTATGEALGPDGNGDQTRVDLNLSGVDVKFFKPIRPRFEAYVRGRASLASAEDVDGSGDYREGRGLGAAIGLQFTFTVEDAVKGALYLELGYDFYRLHNDYSRAEDVSFRGITFGFSVGSGT